MALFPLNVPFQPYCGSFTGKFVCSKTICPHLLNILSDLTRSAHLDLAEINHKQLIESGVPPEKIYVAGLCTFCHPDDFHSYRRDRDQAGRMLSVIGLR